MILIDVFQMKLPFSFSVNEESENIADTLH